MKKGWQYKLGETALEKAILGIVCFWHPKANAWRRGNRWLVYSVDEWREKLPGNPADRTIRRALKNLSDQQILQTERHKHPFQNHGGPVTWVRPNEAVIGQLLAIQRPARGQPVTGTYIQVTDKHKTGEQACEQSSDCTLDQLFDQEDQVKGADFLAAKKASATIQGGLEAFSKTKQFGKALVINTPTKMHDCLIVACKAAGYPVPGAFTAKRAGQMKTFVSRIKAEGVDVVDFQPLLFFVCKKWPEFIGWAKVKFNVTVQGTVPNHDALTMYAAEAVGFWRGYTALGPVQEKDSDGTSSFDEGF